MTWLVSSSGSVWCYSCEDFAVDIVRLTIGPTRRRSTQFACQIIDACDPRMITFVPLLPRMHLLGLQGRDLLDARCHWSAETEIPKSLDVP